MSGANERPSAYEYMLKRMLGDTVVKDARFDAKDAYDRETRFERKNDLSEGSISGRTGHSNATEKR